MIIAEKMFPEYGRDEFFLSQTERIALNACLEAVRIEVAHPTWDDFTWFLESRCFPKTRDHAKDILKEMGLPFYDPLLIIEKTDGRMAGDEQWILILKNKEARHGTDLS